MARSIDWAFARQRATGLVAVGSIGAYFLWHAGVCAILHPHEMAYFNLYAGGLAGAFNKYELDYWGNSYRELADKFVSRYEKERGANPPSCVIYVSGPFDSASKYLPEYCRTERDPQKADFAFFMINTSPRVEPRQIYVVVERFGVPLAYAIDNGKTAQDGGLTNIRD